MSGQRTMETEETSESLPEMLQGKTRVTTQETSESLPEILQGKARVTTQETRESLPIVAMVCCATVPPTLHFSTFDSEGTLLKRFSKPAGDPRPSMLSACGDLVLIRGDYTTFMCDIATEGLISLPDIPTGYGSYGGTGFGYVPSTKEFKILADLYRNHGGFKVLTLGDERWRDAADPTSLGGNKVEDYGGALVNGAIHLWSGHNNIIPKFNLETEEWGSIAGPPRNPNSKLRGYIARIDVSGGTIERNRPQPSVRELSGYLCLMDRWLIFGGTDRIDIWLLKDYHDDNGSWVKECSIPYSALNHDDPFMVEPLAIDDDGKILVQVDTYSLQLYDPKTNSSREVHRFQEEFDNLRSFEVKVLTSLRYR